MPCILIFGGTFDPVHNGHLALAKFFCERINPEILRIIPTGRPWQKSPVQAADEHRLQMIESAFRDFPFKTFIDRQEIDRKGPTYTIDTLHALRAELGKEVSLVFLLGADQLKTFNTWEGWREILNFTHICAASRPGYKITQDELPEEVTQLFKQNAGDLEQIKSTPNGYVFIAKNLSVDISSTQVRENLRKNNIPYTQLPAAVLNYIQLNQLYRA